MLCRERLTKGQSALHVRGAVAALQGRVRAPGAAPAVATGGQTQSVRRRGRSERAAADPRIVRGAAVTERVCDGFRYGA